MTRDDLLYIVGMCAIAVVGVGLLWLMTFFV
jgi:hypothetical protein